MVNPAAVTVTTVGIEDRFRFLEGVNGERERTKFSTYGGRADCAW